MIISKAGAGSAWQIFFITLIGAVILVTLFLSPVVQAREPGSLKWRYDANSYINTTPAIDNRGNVYIASHDQYLYSIDTDGSLNWHYKLGGPSSSPAIGKDGTVYIGSEDGYLYALTREGNLRWRYNTGSKIISSPDVDDSGMIYVGSTDGYLYAVSKEGTLEWRFHTDGDVFSPALDKEGNVYVFIHFVIYLRDEKTL